MAEYIEREVLIRALCDGCEFEGKCNSTWVTCAERNLINSIPAADVREVVRCANCEFAKPITLYGWDVYCCERWYKQEVMARTEYYPAFVKYGTGYCENGREREDGQN